MITRFRWGLRLQAGHLDIGQAGEDGGRMENPTETMLMAMNEFWWVLIAAALIFILVG